MNLDLGWKDWDGGGGVGSCAGLRGWDWYGLYGCGEGEDVVGLEVNDAVDYSCGALECERAGGCQKACPYACGRCSKLLRVEPDGAFDDWNAGGGDGR